MAGPVNTPHQAVCVEYDFRGQRVKSKPFTDHYAARRLYVAKLKQNKNPKVIKHEPPN